MPNLLNTYHLKSIVKQKTCFKIPRATTCIDSILTYSSKNFQDTCTSEYRLSDFQKLVVTTLKLYFPKQKPIFKPSENIKELK